MRVAMFVDSAPPEYGGAGAQAAALAAHLESSHDIQIFARPRRRYNRENIPSNVHFLGRPMTRTSLSHLQFSWLSFRQILKDRPDIVHIHGGYYYALTAAAAARLIKIPSLLKMTLLGNDDPASIHKLSVCGVPVGPIVANMYRLVDVVIAQNGPAKDALDVAGYGNKTVIIPNGFDVATTGIIPTGSSRPYILFAGAVSKRKGIDTLLEAWKALGPGLAGKVDLILAGPVREEVAQFVTSAAARDQTIKVLGQLDKSEVQNLMASALLVSLPTRGEGQSNVLIEAMGFGVPCVTSDIDVNRDTCGEGATYHQVGDVEDLARSILRVVNNRSEWAERSKAAGKRFDFTTIAAGYRELYSHLIEGRSARPIGWRLGR